MVALQIEPRKLFFFLSLKSDNISKRAHRNNHCSGYVALAVATESGTYKRELSTGLGGDRQANMVAFAVEALTLLRDVIKGEAKL